MLLTIFVKKSFFFGAKKNFDGNFLVEISKKREKWLYQMKVGMFIGKVKEFGISWCIPHRMAADNAKGGSAHTPPLIGLMIKQNNLEYGRTQCFAFEIYWPLILLSNSDNDCYKFLWPTKNKWTLVCRSVCCL